MPQTIVFVITYDNPRYLEECIYYINRLQVPCGYCVSIIKADEDKANNQVKYKVYLEQNTYIINENFLYDIIMFFHQNPQIGVAGVFGGKNEDEINIGRFLVWDGDVISNINLQSGQEAERVNVLNGMLVATQYPDIAFEDMEKNGYQIAVPYMKRDWCIYDCGGTEQSAEAQNYRFCLLRVAACHDAEAAQRVQKAIEQGKIAYSAHLKKVEQMNYIPTISGYFWEDYLLGYKRNKKTLSPNGSVSLTENDKKVMHIVMAFNHTYVIYASVMLQSLYENNTLCDICVHILHSELTHADKEILRKQAEEFNNTVEFYDFDKNWLPDNLRVTKEWSVEAYFRLFMGDLLPLSVERVLYLDVDIIVDKPLYELYFMDMCGYEIVACRDFSLVLKEGFDDKRKELFADISTSDNFTYFNSGVMLADMKKLRQKYSGKKYLELAQNLSGKLLAPDQDILNMMHWDNVGLVDEYKYDLFQACLKGLKPEEVTQQTSIIHYAGPKPWMPIDINMHAHRIWWDYAKRTKIIMEGL